MYYVLVKPNQWKENIEWLLEIHEPKLNTWLMLTTHYDILQ
jgi:hypothetical protein